ncbi:hypothetical protein FF3_01311 [Fretibacterium fastidiosum]|uniref:N-acetylmuramoyl-L-alanine amidase n=2 Tax=Fretibacterium fastidiosum TaxID=651822 RepID=UPI0038FC157C
MSFRSRALLACLVLAFCCSLSPAPALASASLYRGEEVLGSVATTTGPRAGAWVCLEDVGALLGFTGLRSGEELQLVRDDVRLRVVMNAAVAWRDIYLVPLSDAPFERDGRCWLDAGSAAALFQRAAGEGERNRLRFQADRNAAVEPEPAGPEEPAAVRADAPPPESEKVAASPASDRGGAPVAQQPARRQERFETFRKDAPGRRPAHPSLDGGELQGLRWSTSSGRIRVVADASDGADPEVRMEGGVLRALFASARADLEGLPSPYRNVEAELKKGEGGAELTFTSDSLRVEKMVLDAPRRIVFDLFFSPETRIQEVPRPAPAPAVEVETTITAPQERKPVPQAPPKGPARGRQGGRKLAVVDPGHGGKDPGASANGVREKDINLAIGLALEKALNARGIDVVMTRRTDVYLTLQERTDIANKEQADVFVSVHANALPSVKRTSGFEIYLMALPTDKDALTLARIENRELAEESHAGQASDRRTEVLLQILGDMQQNNKISESTGLAEALFAAGKGDGIPMKRVAQAPFFVLRGAGMPAVLLETGFVTNATEAKLLAHPGYQARIAEAMAAGVAKYLN